MVQSFTADNRKLVIAGGGGHCKSVLDIVYRMRCFSDMVIADSAILSGTIIMGCRVAGGDNILPELYKEGFAEAVVAVGSIEKADIRKKLYETLKRIGFSIPNIIDPSAVISQEVKMDEGIFVGKNAVINSNSSIGKMAIINTASVIEHDSSVGDYTHVSVNAAICGNVIVGNNTFIGAGATIIQGRHIGNNVVIGAGSTVLRNVESGSKVYGIVK